jgi:hypothetical protein
MPIRTAFQCIARANFRAKYARRPGHRVSDRPVGGARPRRSRLRCRTRERLKSLDRRSRGDTDSVEAIGDRTQG